MVAIHRIITAGEIVRIGNGPCPCKGSIAACSVIKVENGLICAVHGNLYTCADRIVMGDQRGNRYVSQPGFFIAGKIESIISGFNRTRRFFTQIEFDIARGNGNGVFVISSNQRKTHAIAIYGIDACFGEFKSIRFNHIKRLASYYRFSGQKLNLYVAFGYGSKYAVLGNGSNGFVQGFPCDVGGKLRRVAGCTYARGYQLDRSAGYQIIIGGSNQGVIKLRGQWGG